MAFVPAFNTVEVELRQRWDSQKIENTLYFQREAGWDVTSMDALAASLITWWTDELAPYVSNAVSLVEVYMTDLTTETSLAYGYNTGLPVSAVQESPSLPNNVALCISFRTSNRGRSARGRNYVPGMTELGTTGNTITSAIVDGVEAAYFALVGVATANDATWVVCSRYHNNAPRSTATLYLIREAICIDPTVDSQRRRLPGRGQ